MPRHTADCSSLFQSQFLTNVVLELRACPQTALNIDCSRKSFLEKPLPHARAMKKNSAVRIFSELFTLRNTKVQYTVAI
jgi:hypothetical protein